MIKRIALSLFAAGMVSLASAAGDPKTFSDITVGNTVTENGIRKVLPSTAPSGISIEIYISSDQAAHYYPAVTDPAREAGINTMSSSNTFTTYPVMFSELTSITVPPSGKRSLFATSAGFFQRTSSGTISQIGGGGWTEQNSIVSSSFTVVVGSVAATATAGHILEINSGNTNLWEVTSASTTIKSASVMIMTGVSSMTLENAGTFSILNTVFDVSGGTIVIPSYTSISGRVAGEIWFNSSTEGIYIGTIAVSSAGGVGTSTSAPTGWQYLTEVNMTTAPAVVGSTSTVLSDGVIFQVIDGDYPLLSVHPDTTTIYSVATIDMVGASTVTFTNGFLSTTAKRAKKGTTTADISVSQNDYALTGNYEIYKTTASNPISITGIANGIDGWDFYLVNTGTNTITFPNESGSSSAENRFTAPSDIIVSSNTSVHFNYDGEKQRWRRLQ